MPDQSQSPKTHHELLGHILATVALAAIDAGAVATNPGGVVANPAELASIIGGFAQVWAPATFPPPPPTSQLKLPASGQAVTPRI